VHSTLFYTIEQVLSQNCQDFVSSVSTLLTVRSYTMNLRERITLLDQSVTTVGRNLALKKKELLQSKRTATNLDQAIDTLQGCLRILDLVKRVRDMIKDGRYWSALRVRAVWLVNLVLASTHLMPLIV
jgi:exocyst complex component 6